MAANLNRLKGLVHLQQVLLALTQSDRSREDAYLAVQCNAMRVWEKGEDFRTLLEADADVLRYLDSAALDALFDLGQHTRHVETVFARVFGEG